MAPVPASDAGYVLWGSYLHDNQRGHEVVSTETCRMKLELNAKILKCFIFIYFFIPIVKVEAILFFCLANGSASSLHPCHASLILTKI